MPPKDTDLNKTVFMAENGEGYDVIGGFTDINVISSSQSTLDNIMEEHIAAVNKAFIKLSNAIREFTVTINMQNGKIAEVYFPKYLMTEWRFPKKKERNDAENEERKKETGMKRLTFPYEEKLTEHTATIRYGSQAKRHELIDRLARYENLGYDPEDLKMIFDMIIPEKMLESAKRIKEEQEKIRMKFDDMKLEKNDGIADDAEKNSQQEFDRDMVIKDVMVAHTIIDMFCDLSITGMKSLLCSCIEQVAKAQGITAFEFLDEIKQAIKEVRGDGRQTEDS